MKKLKKLTALALTAAMSLGLLVLPANAAMVTATEFDEAGNVVREWSIDTEAGTATPVTAPAAVPGTYFADVPDSDPNAQAINALAAGGLLDGFADENGNFRPNDPITYGELTTIRARIVGASTEPTEEQKLNTTHAYTHTNWSAHGRRYLTFVAADFAHQDDYESPHWAVWATRMYDEKTGQTFGDWEDLELNVIRGDALYLTYMTLDYLGMTDNVLYDYQPSDIPDWDVVEGESIHMVGETKFIHAPYVDMTPKEKAWYLNGELTFWPDRYVYCAYDNYNPSPTGYNMDSVRVANPEMRPYRPARAAEVLAMYNLGLTTGVDENMTCNPLADVTRAEMCALLYRAGLTHVFSE